MASTSALGANWNDLQSALEGRREPHHLQTDHYSPGITQYIFAIPPFSTNVSPRRYLNLLLSTADQISEEVRTCIHQFGTNKIGLVLGTSTAGILEGEFAFREQELSGSLPPTYDYLQQEMGAPAQALARHWGLRGPVSTISTACSSGAKAFRTAWRWLDTHWCDAVIVAGIDTLCQLTVQGFSSLEALSSQRCNPMSLHRKGINLGEAVALFLVQRSGTGPVIRGVGESSDAYHISSPQPEGLGAESAMRRALDEAQLQPQDIDYINLHGTATSLNDRMESFAVSRLFGNHTPCSSTKPLTGHCLGAAGSIEAAILSGILLNSENSVLPPHIWDHVPDPDLAPIRLVQPGECASRPIKHVLSNSFAFGGGNCSLVISRGKA